MLVARHTCPVALVAALSSLGAQVVIATAARGSAPWAAPGSLAAFAAAPVPSNAVPSGTAPSSAAPSSAAPAGGRPLSPALTLTISLAVDADVSPTLIAYMTEETDDIWRQANMTLVWRREPVSGYPSARWMPTSNLPRADLRAVVSNAVRSETEAGLPLGWITFNGPSAATSGRAPLPEAEVHVSSGSAYLMLSNSSQVVGRVATMPRLQRDSLMARAMGRALAHELGHYLLASKTHSSKGLMRAIYTGVELFGPSRLGFTIDSAQRQEIADRLLLVHRLAGR